MLDAEEKTKGNETAEMRFLTAPAGCRTTRVKATKTSENNGKTKYPHKNKCIEVNG
jgi:hypothetical protein